MHHYWEPRGEPTDFAVPDPGPPSPRGWAFFGQPGSLIGEHGHCAECAALECQSTTHVTPD